LLAVDRFDGRGDNDKENKNKRKEEATMVVRRGKRSHRDGPSSSSSFPQGTTAVVVVHPPPSLGSGSPAVLADPAGRRGEDETNDEQGACWERRLEELTGQLLSRGDQRGGDPCPSEEEAEEGDAGETLAEDPLLARLGWWRRGSAGGGGGGDAAILAPWDGAAAELRDAGREMRGRIQEEADRLSQILRERSDRVYQLQLSVTELQATRQTLVQSLEEDVESYLADCKHALSVLDSELEQIREQARTVLLEQEEAVPRLQHAIALYASCTGIKWYDDDPEYGGGGEDSAETPGKADSAMSRRSVWRGQVVRACFACTLRRLVVLRHV
jgi:hypothetical protein